VTGERIRQLAQRGIVQLEAIIEGLGEAEADEAADASGEERPAPAGVQKIRRPLRFPRVTTRTL
jgi:hypothetical protein